MLVTFLKIQQKRVFPHVNLPTNEKKRSWCKEFRVKRQLMLDKNKPLDSFVLIKTLDAFSTTKEYDKRVIRMINKIRQLEK